MTGDLSRPLFVGGGTTLGYLSQLAGRYLRANLLSAWFTRMRRSPAWVLTVALAVASFASAQEGSFQDAVDTLNARSFNDKAAAAAGLAAYDHPRSLDILTALLNGELYTQRPSNRVVLASALDGGGFAIRDAITEKNLGKVNRRGVRKISVNNRLRRTLRGLIAGLQLDNSDPDERIYCLLYTSDAADE